MGNLHFEFTLALPRILSATKGETVASPKTVTYQAIDNGNCCEPAQRIQVIYYNSQLFFKIHNSSEKRMGKTRLLRALPRGT